MKKLILLALPLLLIILIASCDKFNLPRHHHNDEEHALNNIVCTGNRITAGPGLISQSKYPSVLLKNLQKHGYDPVAIHVEAPTSVNIQGMTAQIGDYVDPHKVDGAINIIIVTEILEDTRDNRQSPEVSTLLLTRYCEEARAHGWKVIVATAPYANPFYEWYPTSPFPDGTVVVSNSGYDSTDFKAQIENINELVRTDFASFADGLLDLGADARLAQYSPLYFMPNHLDLTEKGAALVAELAEKALKPLLAK